MESEERVWRFGLESLVATQSSEFEVIRDNLNIGDSRKPQKIGDIFVEQKQKWNSKTKQNNERPIYQEKAIKQLFQQLLCARSETAA